MLAIEDDGHPVVDRRDDIVRLGRDDRTRVDGRSSQVPAIPQPGEGKGTVVSLCNAVRLLCTASLLPLVEPVSEDETAPGLERLAEARFLGDRLGSCVDKLRPPSRIVSPVWDESPADELDLRVLLVRDTPTSSVGGMLYRGANASTNGSAVQTATPHSQTWERDDRETFTGEISSVDLVRQKLFCGDNRERE